ncbi:hypothetical protein BBP40_005155 [Aspergillus hancockii]|nr:hypothetical protein BBP40_005155 [Aspergillus hancockii]
MAPNTVTAKPKHILGTIGFVGLQVVIVTLTGQGVSHLLEIGLHKSEVAIALTSGPLCGAIFQPYFGRWSDQTQTSWGRRKPLIACGTVTLILALLSLAWVKSITRAFIPSEVPVEPQRLCLVIVTLFLMFAIWTAIQAVQVGLRALITDGCSQDEQAYANAWASRYSNSSAALANLLAYLDFLPNASSQEQASSTFQNMSLLATLALAMTTIVSCVSVIETVPKSAVLLLDSKAGMSLRDIWKAFMGSPSQIRTICIVQLFSWTGWFPFLYYIVTYVNQLYYDEKASTGLPQTIVNHSNSSKGLLALSIFGFTSMAVSIILTSLVTHYQLISMRHIWMISHLLFAIFMISMSALSSSTAAIALCGIAGFSWAVSSWIPYALLGAEAFVSPHSQDLGLTGVDAEEKLQDEELQLKGSDLSNDMGLLYGVHNLAICLPQALLSLAMGFERMLAHEGQTQGRPGGGPGQSLIWIFRIAGVAALIAVYFIRGIRDYS